MTIFEINEKLQEAFDKAIDPDTGEIIDENAYAEFVQYDMDKNQKIENVALWAKELDAMSAAIGNEISNLNKRKTAAENKSIRLKEFLQMICANEKFETPKVKISFRSSMYVNITDVGKIPKEYFIPQEPTVNKKAIADMFRQKKDVPGAEFLSRNSINIK